MINDIKQIIRKGASFAKQGISHSRNKEEVNNTFRLQMEAITSSDSDLGRDGSVILKKKIVLKPKDVHIASRFFSSRDLPKASSEAYSNIFLRPRRKALANTHDTMPADMTFTINKRPSYYFSYRRSARRASYYVLIGEGTKSVTHMVSLCDDCHQQRDHHHNSRTRNSQI